MKQILTITAFFISVFSFGQQARLDTSKAMEALKLSSQKMRESLANNNFSEFSNFIYPPIVKMAGGKDKIIELTRKSFKDIEDQGFKISDVTINNPSTIISGSNKLQSVLQENLVIKTNGGHLIAKSYLIAISENGGKTWYFMDTSSKTVEQIKAVFPFLSNKLMLPKKEQPVFYKD